MNKIIALCAVVVLLGAGCQTASAPSEPVVQSAPWFLTFENGDDWQAYGQYFQPGVDFGVPAEASHKRGKNRVWLQNVQEPISPQHIEMYKEDYTYYEGDDWMLVDITVYPKPGGKIPPAGVERVEFGDQVFWTRVAEGRGLYYWESDKRVYEMTLSTAQGPDVGVEELFRTIVEVEGVELAE